MLIQFRTRHSSLLREAHVQCTPFRIMTYFDDVIDTKNIQKLFSVSWESSILIILYLAE